MKKTKSLIKPFSFALFALISIIGIHKLEAQIIYKDLIPDSVYTSWDVFIFKFDINLPSGEGEFYLWHHPQNVEINSYDDCSALTDNNSEPYALNVGDSISPTSFKWESTSNAYLLLNMNGISGNWINTTDKYLGLRYKSGVNWFYGWVRLDIVNQAGKLVVKDYAYESTPNKGIIAGDNGLNSSIQNLKLKDLEYKIFVECKTLNISSLGAKHKADIIIVNSLGQNLLSFKLNNASKTVNLSSFPNGIYFVTIESVSNKKIYKIVLN